MAAENIAKLSSRQERLKALQATGLVRNWEKGDECDGLRIFSGEIATPGSDGWKTVFPAGLLKATDPQLRAEAWEVLLSQNRVLLEGELAKSLIFLKEHLPALKHIKRLDIHFSQRDSIEHWEDGPQFAWEQVTQFLARNFDLDKLELSLDAGSCYEGYRMQGAGKDDLDFLPDIYENIIYTLAGSLSGDKPKRFFVYWAAFWDMEAEGEKTIMGSDYDAEKLGKIPHTARSPQFPHGAPSTDLDAETMEPFP